MAVTETAESLALRLYADCVRDEQVAYRTTADDDVPDLRARIRQLARANGIRIRTAVLRDALVVVRLDAAVWHESAAQMRAKLTPDR